MVQSSATGSNPNIRGPLPIERGADRVEQMTKPKREKEGSTESKEAMSGLNNATQVEQDNWVANVQAAAKAAGGGPDKLEGSLSQNG